jgi:hypothetical protein
MPRPQQEQIEQMIKEFTEEWRAVEYIAKAPFNGIVLHDARR